ncbi:MAG: tRNA threonylcarbamoyladenosine biosynthesis protein TsaE [Polaribacter sp.]|jgi:tRNA threonylcarbamoyladenosine biosynthesis protein TsaE
MIVCSFVEPSKSSKMDRNKTVTITIKDLEELDQVAAQLFDFAGESTCFLLYGEIGAGKTTLVKKICSILGVKEAANSPTFSLVNEYTYKANGKRKLIYHIDLYRLDSLDEAIDIGIEDYLYANAYCFVEWPELVEPIVPEDCVKIKIELSDDSTRKFIFL